jgi:hypothetical protein
MLLPTTPCLVWPRSAAWERLDHITASVFAIEDVPRGFKSRSRRSETFPYCTLEVTSVRVMTNRDNVTQAPAGAVYLTVHYNYIVATFARLMCRLPAASLAVSVRQHIYVLSSRMMEMCGRKHLTHLSYCLQSPHIFENFERCKRSR